MAHLANCSSKQAFNGSTLLGALLERAAVRSALEGAEGRLFESVVAGTTEFRTMMLGDLSRAGETAAARIAGSNAATVERGLIWDGIEIQKYVETLIRRGNVATYGTLEEMIVASEKLTQQAAKYFAEVDYAAIATASTNKVAEDIFLDGLNASLAGRSTITRLGSVRGALCAGVRVEGGEELILMVTRETGGGLRIKIIGPAIGSSSRAGEVVFRLSADGTTLELQAAGPLDIVKKTMAAALLATEVARTSGPPASDVYNVPQAALELPYALGRAIVEEGAIGLRAGPAYAPGARHQVGDRVPASADLDLALAAAHEIGTMLTCAPAMFVSDQLAPKYRTAGATADLLVELAATLTSNLVFAGYIAASATSPFGGGLSMADDVENQLAVESFLDGGITERGRPHDPPKAGVLEGLRENSGRWAPSAAPKFFALLTPEAQDDMLRNLRAALIRQLAWYADPTPAAGWPTHSRGDARRYGVLANSGKGECVVQWNKGGG